jgi:hypothetical protein
MTLLICQLFLYGYPSVCDLKVISTKGGGGGVWHLVTEILCLVISLRDLPQ